MDVATLIGVICGFGVLVFAVLVGGSVDIFINLPGLLIVLGGTAASTLVAKNMSSALGAFKVGLNAVRNRVASSEEILGTIQELSKKVRRDGLLSLEETRVDSEFLAKGIRMAVDGIPVEQIRQTLSNELLALKARHQDGQHVFRFIGSTAPAMGMVGTLIGLVQMLKTLSEPSKIGPAMAVALLTTLYGAVLANIFALPIADKLASRTKDETRNMMLIIDGVEAIAKGESASVVRERLEAYLAPHEKSAEDGKQAA